ncbi:MAG: hypothetical protein KDA25_07700 [Phycisphaerales bacterium]|nr:hypothetical protein [Phycisphaerales bacterium]
MSHPGATPPVETTNPALVAALRDLHAPKSCLACGYSLQDLPPDVTRCPECGERFDPDAVQFGLAMDPVFGWGCGGVTILGIVMLAGVLSTNMPGGALVIAAIGLVAIVGILRTVVRLRRPAGRVLLSPRGIEIPGAISYTWDHCRHARVHRGIVRIRGIEFGSPATLVRIVADDPERVARIATGFIDLARRNRLGGTIATLHGQTRRPLLLTGTTWRRAALEFALLLAFASAVAILLSLATSIGAAQGARIGGGAIVGATLLLLAMIGAARLASGSWRGSREVDVHVGPDAFEVFAARNDHWSGVRPWSAVHAWRIEPTPGGDDLVIRASDSGAMRFVLAPNADLDAALRFLPLDADTAPS